MMSDLLFIAQSPLGYTVECTKSQWDTHIIRDSEHTVMNSEDNIEATRQAIERPKAIYRSSQREDRHVYFGKAVCASYGETMFTKVVVQTPDPSFYPGEVITVFPSSGIKGGIDESEVLYHDDNDENG